MTDSGVSNRHHVCASIAARVVSSLAVCLLCPALASAMIIDANRSASVFASNFLDSHEERATDLVEAYDFAEGLGPWQTLLDVRIGGYGNAGDGAARVAFDTTVSPERVEFRSFITTSADAYSETSGDPSDPGSYTYREEQTLGSGAALLLAVFEVTTPTAYTIEIGGRGDFSRSGERGSTHLARIDPATGLSITLLSEGVPLPGELVSNSGLLAPGEYFLEIFQRADNGESIGLDVVFVIPEPGTATLLLFGLAWLARRSEPLTAD